MALELNEEGYSIAALLEAQKRSVDSEKDTPASTQIKNMLSRVDLAALGKSLDAKSPLTQKADNLNRALNGESKYKTIAVPTGYDPFVPGDATVVNSIGINPSYIDVDTVASHEDDVEILNPNGVLKNQEPVIIREDSIQEADGTNTGQGYQTYSVSTKGRIGKSLGVSAPLNIEDMYCLPETVEKVEKATSADTAAVEEEGEISPDQVEDVFNVGSDIRVRNIGGGFDTSTVDEDFESLAGLIASTMKVVDDIRKLRVTGQPQTVSQG